MSDFSNYERFHNDEKKLAAQNKPESDSDYHKVVTEKALHNELILDLIFDHLPKNNWKLVRLVNKTWLSTLQTRWRDQMITHIGIKDYSSYMVTASYLEQQHPTNNPNDPLQLSRHPIRNIAIRWDLYNSYILFLPGKIGFWELFGHGLKRIEFDRIQIHRGNLLKKLLFELTPNLEEFYYDKCICDDIDKLDLNVTTEYTPRDKLQTNLRYLNIDTSNVFENEWDALDYKPRFPISWIDFFSVFPNIQKLHLEIDPRETERPSDLLKVFEAIDIIRKATNNQALNISELHMGEIGFAHIDVIQKQSVFSSLPISFLNLNVRSMNNNEVILLIQTFKSTLRHLKMKQPHDLHDNYLPNDILPQGLTKLSLCGQVFSSLEFLSCTPNLKELQLKTVSILKPEDCDRLAAMSPLVHLQKLTYIMRDKATLENMQILSKLMPNVKTCICIIMIDAAFQALCTGWAQLEHLDVEFVTDNEDFCVENLVQLKCLKSLKINWMEITDKLIFEAFLKMPLLTKVRLPTLPSDITATKEGLEALKGKLCDDFVI